MYKYILFPAIAYMLVCIIAIIIPASDGYNVLVWKLFVGQIYALPTLFVTGFISYRLYKKNHMTK